MNILTHIDLFSGIGGFALASQWNGFETILFCDNDKFCQKLLERRFNGEVVANTAKFRPQNEKNQQELEEAGRNKLDIEQPRSVPIYGDIRDLDGTKYRGATLLTGGFPCQPFSQAGKRKGKEDDRYLWDEMFRVIKEVQPHWVLAENVYGLLTIDNGLVFNKALSDLEGIGYEVQPLIIPACAVNAPHRRDRVWIIAYGNGNGQHGWRNDGGLQEGSSGYTVTPDTQCVRQSGQGKQEQSLHTEKNREGEADRVNNGDKFNTIINPKCEGLEREKHKKSRAITKPNWEQNWIEVATRFCGVDDGLPARMDGFELSKSRHRVERLKSLGNAIVPQVAYQIIKAIKEVELNEYEVNRQ